MVTTTGGNVGGVVGSAYSLVTNSYNTGKILDYGNNVGGVIGQSYYASTSSVTN